MSIKLTFENKGKTQKKKRNRMFLVKKRKNYGIYMIWILKKT